jgi:uncharacterized protein (TIGR00255 family)
MTGIGSARAGDGSFEISVKAQSVNSRFLDITIRMPHVWAEYENGLRQLAGEMLSRGKVDITFDIRDLREDAVSATFNRAVVNAYLEAAAQLREHENIDPEIEVMELIAMPQVVRLEPKEPPDPEKFNALLRETMKQALADLVNSRTVEGAKLVADMEERLSRCLEHLKVIESQAASVKQELFLKLKDRVTELIGGAAELDPMRLEQEVALIADRGDITEEIVRFGSHVGGMRDMLRAGEAIGKKLDFITQELNREVNTIGSKSRNVEISRAVIEIKSELEKIREQVQNVE